jgi:RNA polymerase-binding protein DksA
LNRSILVANIFDRRAPSARWRHDSGAAGPAVDGTRGPDEQATEEPVSQPAQRAPGGAGRRLGGDRPTDRASHETDRNFTLRLRDRDRKLIAKIEDALRRLDEGSFGTCVECGEAISEARLQARPVTTLCIGCKEEAERAEDLARY